MLVGLVDAAVLGIGAIGEIGWGCWVDYAVRWIRHN